MKRKIFVGILICIVLIISKFSLVNAESGDPEAEILSNIDGEKNVVVSVSVKNMKTLTGTIEFDTDILEYVGIEEKNNWQLFFNNNTFDFSINSQNANNSEKTEILKIMFKVKENTSVLEAGIDLIGLKVEKNDGSVADFSDLNTVVKVNEDSNGVDEEDEEESTEESSEEDGEDNEFSEDEGNGEDEDSDDYEEDDEEEDEVEDEQEEVFQEEAVGNEDEEENKASEENKEDIKEESTEQTNEEKNNANVTENKTENTTENTNKTITQKENLASGKLPQTGVVSIASGVVLIIIAGVVGAISLKKANKKNKE